MRFHGTLHGERHLIPKGAMKRIGGNTMRTAVRKIAIAAVAIITIAGAATLPSTADARWGGGWHGGHWRGGGSGWGLGTGLALGFATAPLWGGAYGPYYGAYGYDGGCVMQRRWVVNRFGHRVLRWVRVCY